MIPKVDDIVTVHLVVIANWLSICEIASLVLSPLSPHRTQSRNWLGSFFCLIKIRKDTENSPASLR